MHSTGMHMTKVNGIRIRTIVGYLPREDLLALPLLPCQGTLTCIRVVAKGQSRNAAA